MRILIALLLTSLSLSAATLRDGIAATTIDGVSSAASVDGVAISGGGVVDLNTDLIAYWDMDEASGNALDSEPTGTAQELTDNATVTTAAGKIGTARQFVRANTEYFSRADGADLSTGSGVSFTIAAWVYLDSDPINAQIVSKQGATTPDIEYSLRYLGTGNLFSFVTTDGISTVYSISATTFGSATTGTWYFVVAIHDAANDVNLISVNAGTQDSAAAASDPADTSVAFNIGAANGANTWDGRIDEVGFWKRALTTAEITELYNAGSGVTCCAFP